MLLHPYMQKTCQSILFKRPSVSVYTHIFFDSKSDTLLCYTLVSCRFIFCFIRFNNLSIFHFNDMWFVLFDFSCVVFFFFSGHVVSFVFI